ncbi:MAG: hypothetical protein AAFS10_28390, partial [Myxococcota bacterium]
MGVSAWTDLDGELMLYGIPEGDVQLQVKAGGYLEVRRPLTLVLKALREADGLEDDVLDIPMDPAGSLQGMVVDTAGNPVGLAQVVGHVVTDTGAQWLMQRDTTGGIDPLVMPDSDEEAPPSFAGMFGFFSDAEGYVEVTGLPAGTVVLEVRRQGYQPTWAGPFRLGPGGTLAGLELRLRRGQRMVGTVVDADGAPVVGARVRIQPAQAPALEFAEPTHRPELPLIRSLWTDEEGRFEATDLPDMVIVRADAPDTLEARLTVALEGREEPVELRLEPPGDAIEGQVLHEGEVGVAGVLIKVAAAEPTSGRACLAVTDDEGRFTLSGCPDAP